MEKWTALGIVLYTMLTLKCYKSSQPPGYIGCFNDSLVRPARLYRRGNNNGTYCMRFCNFSMHRFAGTKGQFCKCYKSNVALNQNEEAECSYPCPGRHSEHCGGNNRISLYNILYVKELYEGKDSLSRYPTGVIITTNKMKTTTSTTTTSSSKSRTTQTQRPQWSKTSQEMSNASYPTEAGSTDVFMTKSISSTSVNDKTETSSTFISPGTANTESDTTTAMPAIYISLPVIVVVVNVTVLVICFILRRKRLKDTAERRKSEDNMDANCSTIFKEPRNSIASNHQYINLEIQPADSTNTNAIYSHLQTTQDTKEHIYNELIGTS